MTSYFNITVRVASAKALAQLKAVEGQVNATNRAVNRGAAGNVAFQRSLALSPLIKYGNQIQWVGRQLQYNFTLPILLAGGAAAKFALDNEKALTRVKKVYGDLGMSVRVRTNEINALSKAFVELSNHFGVAQKDVINIAADWAAAGASGIALANGVKQTLVTMVLGEMDAVSATKALISIQAQYRQGTKELADTIGILNIVENQTGASLSDLITGLSRAAGVARNSGVDVRHLAAYMAALTPAAGSAATAGNGLKTIISRLMAPTLDATQLLKEMGITTSDMAWKSLNAVDRINLLAEAFNKLPAAQKAAVSATLGSRYQLNRFDILLEAVTNHHSFYQKALDATSDRLAYMKQAQKELNQVLESNPQRLKQIWVILQNAMADVIQPLIPVILMAATALKDLFTAFTNLPPEVQKVITLGLLFLAILGPIVRYVGATIALIGVLGNAFHGLGRAIFFTSSVLVKLIALPIQLFITTVGTAIGAIISLTTTTLAALARLAVGGVAAVSGPLLAYVNFVKVAILGSLRITLGNMLVFIVEFLATTAAMALQFGTGSVLTALILPFRTALAVIPNILVALHAQVYISLVRFAAMMRTTVAAIMAAWTLLPSAIAIVMREVWAVLMISGGVSAVVTRTWVAFTTSLAFAFERMAIFITRIWTAMHASLIAIQASMRVVLIRAWVVTNTFLATTWAATMAFIRGAWTATLLFLSSPRLIMTAIARIGAAIAAGFAGVAGSISLPIVAAVAAGLAIVLGLAYAFRDDLAKAWRSVVEYTQKAFNSLPAGIAAAMRAVVDIVYKAVHAVYELFSYLNPFAHHSPSLVENVTAGMAIVRREISSVTSVSGAINKAYADIKKFSDATAELRKGLDSAQRAQDLKNLRSVAPGAVGEFKTLVADLKQLQKLETQLGNTPGMKKMEKQIQANDRAQMKLRLEMLKMGDAGDIDKLNQKLADLAGAREMVTGRQASLRSSGAGSEITGFYDQQIQAIDKQKAALQKQVEPIQKMNDELAELQRRGEMLDLENKLKFDPIRQQAEDVASAIRDIESALSDMTSAASQAAQKKAGNASKIVGPGTQAFLDAAGGDFPIPGGKGKDIGREFKNIPDQSGMIDQFTQDLAKQTAAMFDQFDIFGPLRKKWNAFTTWLGNTTDTVKQNVSSIFDSIHLGGLAKVTGILGSIWNKIESFGKAMWALFGDDIKKLFKDTWGALKKAFEEIGPELEKFKDLWPPLKKLWKELKPVVKALAIIIGVVLLGALKIVTSILANVLGPILEGLVDIIAAVIRVIRGFFEIVLGILTLDGPLIAQGLYDIFGGAFDAIVGLLKAVPKVIWGLVKGLVEGVVDWFKWLYDKLVGHSIVPDLIDKIIDFIKTLPKRAWNALKDLGKKLFDRAKEGFANFFQGMKNKWSDIVTWLASIPSKVKNAIGDLATALVSKGGALLGGLMSGLRDRWETAKLWFQGLKDKILNNIGDPLTMLYSAGKQIVKGLINGIKDMAEPLKKAGEWFAGKIAKVIPGSPVQEGPLKVLNRGYAGGQIVKMLADGMTDNVRYIDQAAKTVAQAANPTLSTAGLGMSSLSLQSALAARVAPVVTAATARANAAEAYANRGTTQSNTGDTTNNFYGDLSFPNISSGDDAITFIDNLKKLGG